MSYQSPIDVIMGQMNISYENEICKAVQNIGINVDKNELLKALQYDRGQYQKGYADRDSEIIRCKDCIHYRYYGLFEETVSECRIGHAENHDGNWFCADGEKAVKQNE